MNLLENLLAKYQSSFHQVVTFDGAVDKLIAADLSAGNSHLTAAVLHNTGSFSQYLDARLQSQRALFAVGGYAERRVIYQKSPLFDASGGTAKEPRRVHLGVDIWGQAGTPVFAFIGGMVHSFAFNKADGDYGATIVLLHQLDGIPFYTLYGHLSLRDIQTLTAGQYVVYGQKIGHFGTASDNGNWPPHLHVQVIADMELKEGDYPGVCAESEATRYLENCPDPDLILQMQKFIS